MTRAAFLAAVLTLLVLAPAPAAVADPAGPTDYQSEVVSIEPPSPVVVVEVIGGDSFLQLTVSRGSEVDVVGYRGEPYLRFGPDGTVEINDNAPSTYLSEDRYGETTVPDHAAPDAEPAWRVVASDGTYAWHDHRSHWMNEARPAAEPGDQILEGVVPLIVDGTKTEVTVSSTWIESPSPAPAAVGAILGVLLAAVVARSEPRFVGAALAVVAVAACTVSWIAFSAVPAETSPSYVPIAAGATALGTAVLGLIRPDTDRTVSIIAPALILGVWGLLRWDWLSRAILPTSVPTADRFVTAFVIGSAGIITIVGVVRLLRPGTGSESASHLA